MCVTAGDGTAAKVPDNGDTQDPQPAVPDLVVSGGGKEVSFYSSSTVESSTTNIVTNSGNAGSGGGLGVGGESGESGGGDGCAGEDCGAEAEAGATVGTEAMPELGEVDSYADSLGTYWNAIKAAPILAAIADIGGSVPEGSCPAWSTHVDAGVTEFDVDFTGICDLWDDVAPVLSAVMLALYGLGGVLILLKA
jgi:hypothetical protein